MSDPLKKYGDTKDNTVNYIEVIDDNQLNIDSNNNVVADENKLQLTDEKSDDMSLKMSDSPKNCGDTRNDTVNDIEAAEDNQLIKDLNNKIVVCATNIMKKCPYYIGFIMFVVVVWFVYYLTRGVPKPQKC